MMSKLKEKEEAIKLRKHGLTYNEILKKVPVAKSSISLWLRSVGLATPQKQRITKKRIEARKRGWEACRRKRIERTNVIKLQAYNEVSAMQFDNNYLWFMGVMLYWAEGAKCKGKHFGRPISFCNSDPLMIKIFILWLIKILRINNKEIIISIYIHENHRYRLGTVRKYWSKITGFSLNKFDKIYFKKHNIKTKRKNTGNDYFGLVKVNVSKSTDKNRKIEFWTKAICAKWGVV